MSGFFPFSLVKNIGGGFFGAKTPIPPVLQTFGVGAFVWNKPVAPVGLTIKSFTVKVIGGGGGGKAANSTTNSFGGAVPGGLGGMGATFASATYLPGNLPASVAGVVGAHGAGAPSPGTQIILGSAAGANGVTGGDSNFGAFITAPGGRGGNQPGWNIPISPTVAGTGAPFAISLQNAAFGGDGQQNTVPPVCDGQVLAATAGGGAGGRINGSTIQVTGNSRGIGSLSILDSAAKPVTSTGSAGGGGAFTLTSYLGALNSGDGAPGSNPGDAGGGSGATSGHPGSVGVTAGKGGDGVDGIVIVITNFVQN